MQSIIEQTERLSVNDRVALEKQMMIPTRPGAGTAGKGIRLYVNYFQVPLLMHDILLPSPSY
jgi:hypothetical protein